MKLLLIAWMLLFPVQLVFGQLPGVREKNIFTRKDSLRGTLSEVRSCYDVLYYDLNVTVDPKNKTVFGSNKIRFESVFPFDVMQIDLFENMKIDRITHNENQLNFEREFDAVFVKFPATVAKNRVEEIVVFYGGEPIEAQRPPWEGGLVWEKDEEGNPWVNVTVQGDGASLWWPNKDHQADEPDSMMIRVTVPDPLMNVSNGNYRGKIPVADGWTRYDWFVSYPINNYNVTLNIGNYVRFSDVFERGGQTLDLDYYVMPYNLGKAKKQFEQVKPMMECFEKHFGSFPFPRDGFKLVESYHLGMEHQSAVAYGNHYRQGYRGYSSSEEGLWFDFIIVHETAHEWWGNSVTSKDIADMWIHEGFGAYAESVYLECLFGYDAAMNYTDSRKPGVKNDQPVIGPFGVNRAGSKDMYNKGALMLNTLRNVIADDALWWETLRGIAETFKHQTITTEDVVAYVNKKTGTDLTYFFDQYLRYPNIPELEIWMLKMGETVKLRYKWNADVADFRMPVRIGWDGKPFETVTPSAEWQELELGSIDPKSIRVADREFFIDVKFRTSYAEPGTPLWFR